MCAAKTPCADGQLCPPNWFCCEQSCCSPASSTLEPSPDPIDEFKETLPIAWYSEWPVLFLLGTLVGILFCCIWCLIYRRPSGIYMCSFACCVPRNRSEGDSAGSVYPPPRYSRCGSFHQAPPPYSEVTSKPDLYPLVITCGEGDGKSGGSYLMVHYFRNYVIRAPGSLSATSTADSLNSSFICNAANEANTMIPPPYSCASSYGDCRVGCGRGVLRSFSSLAEPRRRETNGSTFRENLITSPVQPLDPAFDLELELIDCEMYCDGGCKPRLGSSPPPRRSNTDDSIYDQEMYGIRQLFPASPENAAACESPPQPTSPTQSRESTLRRQLEERRQRRQDPIKKNPKMRKSSLYMPLSVGYHGRTSRISPGSRVSSRSAPATPCGGLVPNLLTFTQRVSASRLSSRSSRLEEENDPLLADIETTRTEHKF
ncbi:uncharacterized protein LOC121731971 isoform X2 [Aricia agestis]|uniref:uncharacterized protein LOC121731971 isoform X2 n=1 Tax=Aricia agestis TaxID=91739 RepID=UPI001C2085BD|nr:uncharacterized protein LOC121731971 isoform X2 [Aricia agestis]